MFSRPSKTERLDAPQVIYVQQAPKRTSCLTWLAAIVLIPIVFGLLFHEVTKDGGSTPASASGSKPELTPRQRAQQSLEIVSWKWGAVAGGSIMEATFKIRNNGTEDFKDIEIECVHTAPSGTVIDSNKRVIYEVVKAGETREFKDFNMGFIHSQAKKSSARIRNATPLE